MWSWVFVEAALVGLGMVVLAAAIFAPLRHYGVLDLHVVTEKMHTGWAAYGMLAGGLFGLGALFHLLFELFGWNRRYCVAMF